MSNVVSSSAGSSSKMVELSHKHNDPVNAHAIDLAVSRKRSALHPASTMLWSFSIMLPSYTKCFRM
jgi:hypothetical protein